MALLVQARRVLHFRAPVQRGESMTEPKLAKVQDNFRALSSVSTSLNTASDELVKAVSILDEALKKLNIGLTVWVTFRSRDLDGLDYDDDQIGYGKVNGKWGIALRRIWGDHATDRHNDEGPWSFGEAPRELRMAGVDGIPKLIETLSQEASSATKKIQEKTQEVRELASVIEHPGKPPAPPAPIVPPKAAPQKPPAPPAPPNADNTNALHSNLMSLNRLIKNSAGDK